jgi:cadmium resistance protein CadD (predicted permease)
VHWFASELLIAVFAFTSTNIDDLLLLSSLFIDSELRAGSVVIGQFVGMSLLILMSIFAAHLLVSIPPAWIRLLGLIPLCLGILRLAKNFGRRLAKPVAPLQEAEFVGRTQLHIPQVKSGTALATVLTIANGGDNLSVYIPLFAMQRAFVPLYVAVFSVMTVLWCFVAYLLTNHDLFRDKLNRYARILGPCILIAIGAKVLLAAVPAFTEELKRMPDFGISVTFLNLAFDLLHWA